MGVACLIGLHDEWSGWQQINDGWLPDGMHHPCWLRQCLDCGELERRQRPPAEWCGIDQDDHDWQGSAMFPLRRVAPNSDGGGDHEQTYKRCRECGGERVFWG
jgi:hypothetical protein